MRQQHVLEVESRASRRAEALDPAHEALRPARFQLAFDRLPGLFVRVRAEPLRAEARGLLAGLDVVAATEQREQVIRVLRIAGLGEAPRCPAGEDRPERMPGLVEGRGGVREPGRVARQPSEWRVAAAVDPPVRIEQGDGRERVEDDHHHGGTSGGRGSSRSRSAACRSARCADRPERAPRDHGGGGRRRRGRAVEKRKHLLITGDDEPNPSKPRGSEGQHRLKNAIWLSAFCSLHHNRSRDDYARKRSGGKLHNAGRQPVS